VLGNLASERALAAGQQERARSYAETALAAATAVGQASEALLARARLAQMALRAGGVPTAAEIARDLDAALALGPWAATARARAAAAEARTAVTGGRVAAGSPTGVSLPLSQEPGG
jgi:hypothetical protein